MDKEYYAHSLEGKPPSEWQQLDEHLNNVAVMARSFAEKFDCGALALNSIYRRQFNLKKWAFSRIGIMIHFGAFLNNALKSKMIFNL